MRHSWLVLALAPVAVALMAPPAAVRTAPRTALRSAAPLAEMVSEAKTVPEALADLWALVADLPQAETRLSAESCAPLRDVAIMAALFEHLEVCKDSCDSFGTHVVASPDGGAGFRVRPVARKAGADPYAFDDNEDFAISASLAALLEKAGGLGEVDAAAAAAAAAALPDLDAAGVVRCCKDWVNAVVSDAGICPFSLSADRAGLPIGDVRYDLTDASSAEAVYAWYWREVAYLLATPKCATSLLVLSDRYWIDNLEAFETLGGSLAQALQTGTESDAAGLGMEDRIQLVFFHPDYVFRDGADRQGADAEANFARRSPFPMINVLRTPQVKAAQRGLPTGLVYEQNERTLKELGEPRLAQCLRDRDWSAVSDVRVDRRNVEVLSRARSLMADAGVGAGDDLDRTGADAERASAAAAGCPVAAAAEAAAAAAAPAPAPADAYADWASATDPATGAVYYFNQVTGASSWDWPPQLN